MRFAPETLRETSKLAERRIVERAERTGRCHVLWPSKSSGLAHGKRVSLTLRPIRGRVSIPSSRRFSLSLLFVFIALNRRKKPSLSGGMFLSL